MSEPDCGIEMLEEAVQGILDTICANIRAHIGGAPMNVVT